MLLYKTFKSTNKQGYEFIVEMLLNMNNPIIKTFSIPFLLLFIVVAYPSVFYTTFLYIKNTTKEVKKMSSLSFEDTGHEALDHLLYVLKEASYYANDSTRWDELTWHSHLEGETPYASIEIAIESLSSYLNKYQKQIKKLQKAGYIE